MYEELKREDLIEKAGGRFRLSALIQKRLVYLNRDAPPLVETKSKDKMAIVIQEIMEDKIYLDMEGNMNYGGDEGFKAPDAIPGFRPGRMSEED